ncbi:MAG TPA: FAD-binding oxidoreductase [bacterium]|nr:FAD-binding oxidoreductase [bacterium]
MIGPSVAVIGGGAIGLSTALQLAELGASPVRVLERAYVASGSSGLSVGIIETQYLDPLDIELRVRSMEFFSALERRHNLTVTRNGYLRLAHRADELAAFETSVKMQRNLGVRDARTLSRREVLGLVPHMHCDDVIGGLFGPSDGYIDGHLYCNLLADLAKRRNAEVRTQVTLVRAEKGALHRHRLITTQGEVECDFVVNAAGAWAGEIGALLGAPVKLLPQRHQVTLAHLPRPLAYVMPSVMDYIPHSGDYGLYLRHDTRSRLLVGLHTEEPLHDIVDPNNYSRSTDYTFLEAVAEKFALRFPLLDGARLAAGWAGLYPVSPDGLAQVGPTPGQRTVISACGVGGSGLQTSPAIGRLAAEWVVFGEPRSIPTARSLTPLRYSLA